LRSLILHGRNTPEARASLERFEALYPYLQMISEAAGHDPFDRRVVEAYWIGNELLDLDWREAYTGLLHRLPSRGLPNSFAMRLLRSLPRNPIPHHTFHVLFVGVGAVTGHVPTTLRNMDRCRISWGRVDRVEEDRLTVRGPHLQWTGEAFRLEGERTAEVEWDPALAPAVEAGDTVAIHWDTVVERIHEPRLRELKRHTLRAIEAANEAVRDGEAYGR
jgi:hypothetical protein